MLIVPLYSSDNLMRAYIYSGFGLFGIILAILCYKSTETFKKITSSFIGSYLIARGTSLLIGGFMNEITIGYADEHLI